MEYANKQNENAHRGSEKNVSSKGKVSFNDNRTTFSTQGRLVNTIQKKNIKSSTNPSVIQMVTVKELPGIYDIFNEHYGILNISYVQFNQALIAYIHRKYPDVVTRNVITDFLLNLNKNDVISMVVMQLRDQGKEFPHEVITFADQNLQDAERRIDAGDKVHATHLAVEEGLDEKRTRLMETGRFTEDSDVMITGGGTLMRGGLPYEPPVFPGTQTMIISHPWTTGMPSRRATREQVQELVSNILQVPEQLGVPKAEATFRSRSGRGGVSMVHVNAYTPPTDERGFTGLYPYAASIPGKDVTHSRTNQTQSTITPSLHSVTVQYANFREVFLDLIGLAAQYTNDQSPKVERAFSEELGRALLRREFPPNLNTQIASADTLLDKAVFVIDFDARRESSTRDVLMDYGRFLPPTE